MRRTTGLVPEVGKPLDPFGHGEGGFEFPDGAAEFES